MSYPTPQAFRAALTRQAKVAARGGTRTVQELLEQFYLARLLARVFLRDPTGWILKGGQALLMRYPDARHSRDVDLVHGSTTGPDMDAALDALQNAAALDLDDNIRFEFLDFSAEADGQAGRKARFEVYIGTTKVNVIGVDLVVVHQPVGAPVARTLRAGFEVEGISDWPTVLLYPIEDHVADKICAMLERHGEKNTPSGRYRDLVDLVLIILREEIDGEQLRAVLHGEVARRQGLGIVIELPTAFSVPDPTTWEPGYAKQARLAAGLSDEFHTLGPAEALAAVFIEPLLERRSSGTWDPTRRSWSS